MAPRVRPAIARASRSLYAVMSLENFVFLHLFFDSLSYFFHTPGWEDELNCLKCDERSAERVETNGVASAKFPGRGLGLVTDNV